MDKKYEVYFVVTDSLEFSSLAEERYKTKNPGRAVELYHNIKRLNFGPGISIKVKNLSSAKNDYLEINLVCSGVFDDFVIKRIPELKESKEIMQTVSALKESFNNPQKPSNVILIESKRRR